MLAVSRRRRPHVHTVVGVAIYAVFLLTAPFEHHDLLCHLKTPLHCTACTSSLLSAHPNTPAVAGTCHLTDAGDAVSIQLLTDGFLLTVHSTGRSPPAVA